MSSKTKTTAKIEGPAPAMVPKLRFSEFQGDDPWKDMPIESIFAVRDERRVPTADIPLYSLTIENGITEKTDRYNREFLVRDAGNKKYKLVEPNDIVYNPSNLRWGAINYSQLAHAVVVSPIYEVVFLRDDSQYFLEFVACSVMRHEQITRFITKAQGTLVERIAVKIEDFVTTRLPVPTTRAEQQKIAECLSSVDELMAAQARKVDALKTHKKGLMQQLFPGEGETQPRLRFPEFQNAGEWEERSLGSFIEEFRGKSTIQDEYEVMTSARSGLVRQRDYYDNDRITERDNIGFNVIPPNYMTYRSRSDDRQFYFNENNLGITGIVSVYYPVFRVINGSNKFLIELLSAFSRVVGKYSVGTSQTVLSLNQLGRIRLPFPPTVKEQQRIATCLSSLDALITAATQQLEALKTHKKGLMQQLFPSPEEVEA